MLNTLQHIHRRLGSWLAAGIACLLLPACVNDDSPCPPEDTPEKGVYLRFDIVTRGTSYKSSRAIDMPESDQLQEGSIEENYIDVPNMLFMLFDKDQNFLCPISPDVVPEEGSNYSRYHVSTVLYNPYFTKPETSTISFYILVFANYNCTDYDPKGVTYGKKLSEMFGENSPTIATPTHKASNSWWYPNLTDNGWWDPAQYMPMTGLQKFDVNIADMKASTPESPLNISLDDHSKDINMLRALAKIEVIDCINGKKGEDGQVTFPDERSFIEKVELEGYYNRLTLLPRLAQWTGYETQYVTQPNVLSTFTYRNPKAYEGDGEHPESVLNFGFDEEATNRRGDGCKVYSVYLPEYIIPTASTSTSTPTMETNQSWIQVTIQNPPGFTVQGGVADNSSFLYELKLKEYPNGVEGNDINILRNNIYRYEILSVSANLINLQWTVCPMDATTVDIPAFN